MEWADLQQSMHHDHVSEREFFAPREAPRRRVLADKTNKKTNGKAAAPRRAQQAPPSKPAARRAAAEPPKRATAPGTPRRGPDGEPPASTTAKWLDGAACILDEYAAPRPVPCGERGGEAAREEALAEATPSEASLKEAEALPEAWLVPAPTPRDAAPPRPRSRRKPP